MNEKFYEDTKEENFYLKQNSKILERMQTPFCMDKLQLQVSLWDVCCQGLGFQGMLARVRHGNNARSQGRVLVEKFCGIHRRWDDASKSRMVQRKAATSVLLQS